MNQTRIGSLIESVANVLVGFSVNFSANFVVFPLFGWHVTVADNFILGGIYTAISVARSYVIRRWFNARLHAAAMRLAGAKS